MIMSSGSGSYSEEKLYRIDDLCQKIEMQIDMLDTNVFIHVGRYKKKGKRQTALRSFTEVYWTESGASK